MNQGKPCQSTVVLVATMLLLASRGFCAEAVSSKTSASHSEVPAASEPESPPPSELPTPYHSYVSGSDESDSPGIPNVDYEKHEYWWMTSLEIRHAETFVGDIKRLTHVTLSPVCFQEDDFSGRLFIGGARVEYESGSKLDLLTKDPWIFEAGLAGRGYFNSPRNGLSPYVGLSLAYQALGWDYRTPLIVDGKSYSHNAVSGVEGTVSLGITTLRDSPVSLYGEVGIGGTLFVCDSINGYRNELIDGYAFVFAQAGVTFKF